ncbi:MAG: peptidoglycan bridge formation glycyltransferase FemA/FemB family protein [Candidatus Shapirobacteria bacterium]
MTIKVLSKVSKNQYNQRVSHPLQSFEWGELRESYGVQVERFGVWQKERLVSAFQVFFHPVPKSKFTIGYFPRGEKPNKAMIRAIKKIALEKKAIFVKFEPNQIEKIWKNNKGRIQEDRVRETKFNFAKLGLSPSAKTTFDPYTFILNIKNSESELLESFHNKTRYNIRLSKKRGVRVSEDSSPIGLTIFTKLLFEETVKRQGFYMHSPDYFKKLWDQLGNGKAAKILLAKYKGNVLAAWMLFFWKDTLYYPYGASSSQFRNLMASNLICWEAIKIGKREGCQKFDMWGGLPPSAPSSHPWYGFHRFKQGYGGDLVKMVGSWDLVINKPLYGLYNLAEKARWKILRLRKR